MIAATVWVQFFKQPFLDFDYRFYQLAGEMTTVPAVKDVSIDDFIFAAIFMLRDIRCDTPKKIKPQILGRF